MKSYKGFIVYPDYVTEENKTYVQLYGRLSTGKSFLSKIEFKPYFFIKVKDRTIADDHKLDITEGAKTTFSKEPVIKVEFSTMHALNEFKKTCHQNNVQTYEADILPHYRYMYDNNILAYCQIKGEAHDDDGTIDYYFENPKVTGVDPFKMDLKVLSIDIETNMTASQLYSISYYAQDFQDVHVVSKKTFKNAKSYATEKEVLEQFIKTIKEYDPDIVVGWNFIDFDMMVLETLCKKHKIPFILSKNDTETRLKLAESFMYESKCENKGRLILDGIALLKNNWVALPDYKLNTAAKELLNDEKLIDWGDSEHSIEDIYKNDTQTLIDYNLKDSKLVIDILDKEGLIILVMLRSALTGMPIDRVNASIASLDSLYIRSANQNGYVCPTSMPTEKEAGITGGYVKDPEVGLYKNVIVLDFKSLYPSIIRTFNIDPIAFTQGGDVVAPNGARFKNDKGLLPEIIARLLHQREIAKKNKDPITSQAIKITMNSFFGVMANPNCRFFSLDMANAITGFGQLIIKETAQLLEDEWGYNVIYSDTDSVFIDLKEDDVKTAAQKGKEIEKRINDHLKKEIKNKYNRDSQLEIEYEKHFVRFLMPRQRGRETGAKKRYAGLTDKDTISFTGLEYVRQDWTQAAKEFQYGLFDLIFHDKDVDQYIRDYIDNLRKGKYDDKLVYVKSLRKDVDFYTKTTPPHVKAAKKLDAITSNQIKYLMTTDGPEPLEKLRHQIDYEHYIDKQIKPIADSVLIFLHKGFDEITSKSKQQSLFDF